MPLTFLALKFDCDIWNFVAILYGTRDISTSGLAAANGRHLEIPTSGYIGQYR